MSTSINRLTRISILYWLVLGAYACTPEAANNTEAEPAAAEIVAEPVAPEPQPMRPVFVSSKVVTTDCGVQFMPDSPPGLANAPGAAVAEMPPAIAGFQAVGAERPMVETDHERVSPGYVLIEPGSNKQSFLINNDKQVVATVEGDYYRGFSQLLDDGSRLVSAQAYSNVFNEAGGQRGCIEEYSASGELNWRLKLSTDQYIHHHDLVKLDNGNILAVVWENEPAAHAIAQGRNPDETSDSGQFWYDGVIEINPHTAEIVWEWSARNHLVQDFDPGKPNYGVVADHPELLDINTFRRQMNGSIAPDWTHVNAMDYNPELDQIILSSNYLSEIWVIDHSTTPREAARHTGGRYGKGGDFLYRWGNPERYGQGTAEDRTLFAQHDVQWIKPGLPGAGNILIFNNGDPQARPYSTVVEIVPETNADGSYVLNDGMAYGPEELAWEYDPEPDERFYSFFISGAQRLENGNTLVDHGAAGKLREVTSTGDIVWEYRYEDDIDAPHMLFRAYRYPADHPGLEHLLSGAE